MSTDTDAIGVAKLLTQHDHILIVSHQRPDGDCFGSTAGLLAGLQELGKTCAAYNFSGVPKKLEFIPFSDQISDSMPEWKPELTVFVDCGNISRVADDFKPKGKTINIDHHATNDAFGDVNYIDIKACAVGEQIYHILKALGATITTEIANALYASVCADTGSFRYSTTHAGTFEMAKILAQHGANPAVISENLFESKTRQEARLQALALSRTKFPCMGCMTWSEMLNQDYEEVGGRQHEPEGLSTELRSVQGVELAILFTETEEGGLRASLRGKGRFDCAELAQNFGGGGHQNAAGIKDLKSNYEEKRDEILALAQDQMMKAIADKRITPID